MTVTIVTDDRFRDHDPGPSHPESPHRMYGADAGVRAARQRGLKLAELPARSATREELERVHTSAYVDALESARGRSVRFDPDTATSPGSIDAAYLAAGGCIDLVSAVAKGDTPPGIALVRPPGHHATPDRVMGFCLISNLAVAARALIATGLAERVAIYDWDVHHGNGTQDAFYDDPNVLYLSTHQWPFYPGTGAHSETGRGAGEGTNFNVPLPSGTGDDILIAVSRDILVPMVQDFSPDVILISAGFDPYVDDPIGGFTVTAEGFATLASIWRDLAEKTSGGRIAAVLEGGYDLAGLGRCVDSLLGAWNT